MKKRSFILRLMALASLLFLKLAYSLNPDGIALIAFRKGLKDPHRVLDNWRRTDEDPCRWKGIVCNAQTRRVEILNLPRSHLIGMIAPEIGRLDKLRRLGLHNNKLCGSIPTSIGNCTELRAIYLQNNLLSGSLPSELGLLENVRILDASHNTLSGHIPASLGSLENLIYLNVSNNFLNGTLPPGFDKFTSTSFIGNAGLCGPKLNKSCEAATSVHGLQSKISRNLMLSALGTVTASLCLALICLCGFLLYNKFDTKPSHMDTSEGSEVNLVILDENIPYTSKEIVKRIENLDYKDIIGAGGFGTVYRMCMDDEHTYAVKKIAKPSSCGDTLISQRLFEKEISALARIKHVNLVGLRGFCDAPFTRLLITDYVPYGSLDELLHERRTKDSPMTWGARVKVAVGTARALSHLHHSCSPPVIHRDLKSSNILVDSNLVARISDFGISKLLEESDYHVTTIVAGTFGYLAPEYMQSGRATEKSDVYSYGVVLLELISGKRPTDVMFTAKGLNIVGWANTMIQQNRCMDILDPHCEGAELEGMEVLLQLATMCVYPRLDSRPTMLEVASIIEEHFGV